MIALLIDFSDGYMRERTLDSVDVPCVCKLGTSLEVEFAEPFSECKGYLDKYDSSFVESLVDPMVGGRYFSVNHGLITLKRDGSGVVVQKLVIFDLMEGWQPIIDGGEYLNGEG